MTYDDNMRTIIDLSDDQIEALKELCRRERISRAEAVRRAVASYTKQQMRCGGEEAFGLWKDRRADGVGYQRRLRREW